ncbi:MAG: glucosamine-6-phosphate deaminase [Acidobacteriota bacterium]
MPKTEVKRITIDGLKLEIHCDKISAGRAAADAAARAIEELKRRNQRLSVIFATGSSQMATLDALTANAKIPWKEIEGFHMDEYVGMSESHPASFRRYLRERLTDRVPIGKFFEVEGDAPNPEQVCRDYAERLKAAEPKLCLLGVGENGHLAFNDPAEADFNDPLDVKIVELDARCKLQQVAEGWFGGLDQVPNRAITLTIPALLRVPQLIVSVPGLRKAAIVRRTVEDPITTACPATILRRHPNATLYLDLDSSSELEGVWQSR